MRVRDREAAIAGNGTGGDFFVLWATMAESSSCHLWPNGYWQPSVQAWRRSKERWELGTHAAFRLGRGMRVVCLHEPAGRREVGSGRGDG